MNHHSLYCVHPAHVNPPNTAPVPLPKQDAPHGAPAKEKHMDRKPLYAALVAAVFAFPLAANANDKAGNASGTASASSANDGGAEAMFAGLDKNKDGFLSKDEVKGTPHETDFASLDKNGDGKLSR